MDTVIGAVTGRSTRAGQDETSPFPLEFMVARSLRRKSQDETSPFPLDFMVIAGKRRSSQDETSPFPLEYRVTLPDADGAVPPAPSRHRARCNASPPSKLRGVEASRELREYAARVASGEALPPYRGPVLAREELSASAAREQAGRTRSVQVKAVAKLALGVLLIGGALVAATVGGDDAELRATGESIGRWFSGRDASFDNVRLPDPARLPCNEVRGSEL